MRWRSGILLLVISTGGSVCAEILPLKNFNTVHPSPLISDFLNQVQPQSNAPAVRASSILEQVANSLNETPLPQSVPQYSFSIVPSRNENFSSPMSVLEVAAQSLNASPREDRLSGVLAQIQDVLQNHPFPTFATEEPHQKVVMSGRWSIRFAELHTRAEKEWAAAHQKKIENILLENFEVTANGARVLPIAGAAIEQKTPAIEEYRRALQDYADFYKRVSWHLQEGDPLTGDRDPFALREHLHEYVPLTARVKKGIERTRQLALQTAVIEQNTGRHLSEVRMPETGELLHAWLDHYVEKIASPDESDLQQAKNLLEKNIADFEDQVLRAEKRFEEERRDVIALIAARNPPTHMKNGWDTLALYHLSPTRVGAAAGVLAGAFLAHRKHYRIPARRAQILKAAHTDRWDTRCVLAFRTLGNGRSELVARVPEDHSSLAGIKQPFHTRSEFPDAAVYSQLEGDAQAGRPVYQGMTSLPSVRSISLGHGKRYYDIADGELRLTPRSAANTTLVQIPHPTKPSEWITLDEATVEAMRGYDDGREPSVAADENGGFVLPLSKGASSIKSVGKSLASPLLAMVPQGFELPGFEKQWRPDRRVLSFTRKSDGFQLVFDLVSGDMMLRLHAGLGNTGITKPFVERWSTWQSERLLENPEGFDAYLDQLNQ